MRIPSGVNDQYIYFVAVDATDLKTRETGLTSFTVYRSRNNGTATAYTTPTVAELSAANMPGVYSLLLDEDMTLDAGDDSQEVCLHITQASMAPVTRVFELYRPKITAGETVTAANGAVDADIERLQGSVIATPSVAGVLEADVTHFGGAAGAFASGRPDVNTSHVGGTAQTAGDLKASLNTIDDFLDTEVADIQSRLPAALTAGGNMKADALAVSDAAGVRAAVGLAAANLDTQLAAIDDVLDTEVAAIKAKTDNLPTSPANEDTLVTIAGYLDTEVVAIKAKTDQLTFTAANKVDASADLTTQAKADVQAEIDTALDEVVADSIPADGVRPSVRQALYMLAQFMLERTVSGTTVTVKKPDGATALLTLTLDSATAPTGITRAT